MMAAHALPLLCALAVAAHPATASTAQTPMTMEQLEKRLDRAFADFPAEVQVGGETDSVRVTRTKTRGCKTRLTARTGTRTIDWATVDKVAGLDLFSEDVTLTMGREQLYLGAPSSETEDGQPHRYEIGLLGAVATEMHKRCRG